MQSHALHVVLQGSGASLRILFCIPIARAVYLSGGNQSNNTMRILIIEDDKSIARSLKAGLETEYFVTDVAEDGERGSFLARTNDYDVIILDNMLPKKSGGEVCKEIRRAGKTTPIIMLSQVSEAAKKAGLLNDGADDYVVKPFSFSELIARIRAILRRPTALAEETIRVADLTLNAKKHLVIRGGKEVRLTPKEYMLLELLMRNNGVPVSRGIMMEHVWGAEMDPFSNTIEAHMLNLRKKIDTKGKKELIKTVQSIGYKIG